MTNTLDQDEREFLLDFVNDHFSLQELREMAFKLCVEHELFPQNTRNAFCLALIEYLVHRDAIGCLLEKVYEVRSKIFVKPDRQQDYQIVIQLLSKFPCKERGKKLASVIIHGCDRCDIAEIKKALAKLLGCSEDDIGIIGVASGSLRLLISIPKETTSFDPGERTISDNQGNNYKIELSSYDLLENNSRNVWQFIAINHPPIINDGLLHPTISWETALDMTNILPAPLRPPRSGHRRYRPVHKDISIKEDFDPNLYIEREAELRQAREWLEGTKRVLTVTAAPATGKSWFLDRFWQFFDEQAITLWIDVNDLMAPREQRVATSPAINPQKTREWLKQFLLQVKQYCHQLHNFEANKDISVTLETLARQLVEYCWSPERSIYIFIDEGDEIKGIGWQQFEDQILGPLAQQEKLRFIISLRGDQQISSFPLRFSEQRLLLRTWNKNIDGSPQGRQQLQALLEHASPDAALTVQHILESLPEYDLSHPGINRFIYLFAQSNPKIDPHTLQGPSSLATFLQTLNPQSRDDPQLVSQLLIHIMEFPQDEWVIEELADWLGVSNTIAWEYVELLRANWLIENNANRQKVINGVREYVRAILNLPEDNRREANTFIQEQQKKLLSLIVTHFDLSEIQILCFKLGINHQELKADTLTIKAVELIGYCERRGMLNALIVECQLQRQHIIWQL